MFNLNLNSLRGTIHKQRNCEIKTQLLNFDFPLKRAFPSCHFFASSLRIFLLSLISIHIYEIRRFISENCDLVQQSTKI